MVEGTVQDQIQWLIRKNTPPANGGHPGAKTLSSFTVIGPFLTDQVREMLRNGMLELEDEICPENGYWFSLHETAELKRFFGGDQIVVARPGDEETTEPDLEVTRPDFVAGDEDKTPPSIDAVEGATSNGDATAVLTVKRSPAKPAAPATFQPGALAPAAGAPAAAKPGAPAAKPHAAPARAATAQELSRQFQRVTPVAPSAYTNPGQAEGRSATIMGMEKGRIIAVLIGLAIIAAAVGVVWVIKSLRA